MLYQLSYSRVRLIPKAAEFYVHPFGSQGESPSGLRPSLLTVTRTLTLNIINGLYSIHQATSHSTLSEGWARSSGHATRTYAAMDTSVAAAAIIVIHTPTR